MPAVERSNLHVEGTDDVHVVKHLLLRHEIDCPIKGDHRSQGEFAPNVPEIRAAGGMKEVLDAITAAVPLSTHRSVGFVLDADDRPPDRWRAVCDRLRDFGLDPPAEIPPEGFTCEVAEFRARVGVWLMPDNRQEGALEQFLQDLIDDDDVLLPIAERATQKAADHGATFTENDHRKAVLHAWLAWQREPSLPYGAAIKARFFRHESPAARAFVDWYNRVFP